MNQDAARHVTTAFLLGWVISETLGHARRGTRRFAKKSVPSPDYSPRLVVSGGTMDKAADAFILSANRIVQFYRSLEFESPPNLSPLTQEIEALPARLEAWLAGQSERFYSPRELRELLNNWSVELWARLNAESEDAARALTAGMSLADTYWYLRPPSRRPKDSKLGEENWRRLLSRFRLNVERHRLETIAESLPRYAAAVICNHLRRWSIGGQLGYRGDRLGLIREMKQSAPLTAEHETQLQEALGHQTQNWSTLLFGLREAESYLVRGDRVRIALGRGIGLFVVLLITALLLAAVTAYLAYFLSLAVFPFLLHALVERQAGVSDWLAVVSLLWTALIAIPVPFVLRAIFQGTRTIQTALHDRLTVRYIAARTYVNWDRYLDGSAR